MAGPWEASSAQILITKLNKASFLFLPRFLLSIMVRAWYMDKAPGDQRLEHRAKETADVPLDRLASLGVLYWKVKPVTVSFV